MNKKLELLGYVFNKFPISNSDIILDSFSIKEFLLKEFLEPINEILELQDKYLTYSSTGIVTSVSPFYFSVGDTVGNTVSINPSNRSITLGNTILTENDLIKIKNSSIFNE